MSDGQVLSDCMRRWPNLPDGIELQGIAGRVLDAARDLHDNPECVGEADLFSLVSHWLRHDCLTSGVRSRLTIPAHSGWPSASKWRDRGFEVTEQGEKLRISVKPWTPDLEGPLPAINLTFAAPGIWRSDQLLPTQRRAYSGVTSDPFFADVFPAGRSGYRTSAQRAALRAALTAPPGASVVISLPTGGGKSAVALVPSLIGSPDDLSLFIMPTTALALDQERAIRDYRPPLRGPFAYHSELSLEQKNGFRDRIRSGEQRVVFTSPEAALNSLRGALFHAAEAGRLRYLVVDEAHMISEWGDEFRPEFQHLAGLRWDLLRRANQAPVVKPFRTLLLSATLTRTSLETLQALFGGEHFQVVASVSIRPEPFFLKGPLTTKEERLERLPELITHLPKPLVVYVTKREDAAAITDQLRQAGFRRLGRVTGDTPAEARRRVIDDWRRTESGTRIDIVVANSAFGLGIDMDEIRTVIHACIPETYDRFYQEVGRGGRDGYACLSILLPAESDEKTAIAMSSPTLIGETKGADRWKHMLRNSTRLNASRYRVDVRDLPPHQIDNDLNRVWNLRTLALMARARLIRLRAEPPQFDPEAAEQERTAARDEYHHSVIVELTDVDSLSSDAWEEQFRRVRSSTNAYFRESFARVRGVVQGKCPFERAKDTYALSSFPLNGGGEITIVPQGFCGGCVQHDFRATMDVLDIPAPPAQAAELKLSHRLDRLFQKKSTLLVTYPEGSYGTELDRRFRWVIRTLSRNGVVEFVEDRNLVDDRRIRHLHRQTAGGFIFFSQELPNPTCVSIPTAVFVSDGISARNSLFFRPPDAPPCIVLAPEGLAAPWKPEVRIGRAWSPHWPIADLEAALS